MSLSRALSRPLSRPLTRTLTAGSSFLDVDAVAYIAAVEAAGATVSAGQVTAVDTFYKAAKADGYYTSLKRLYLPIWGVAAANAIDMIGLTSGTFVGGVTHAAGYVQGNGSTGYFNFNSNPSDSGLTTSSSSLVALSYSDTTDLGLECLVAGPSGGVIELSLFESLFDCGADSTRLSFSQSYNEGILIGSQMGDVKKMFLRNSSGFTNPSTASIAVSGSIPTIMAAMTRWGQFYSNNKIGAYGMNLGIDSNAATSFSLALKNLWETATGLTLP